MSATETESVAALLQALEPHFHIHPEVWLRHPLTGADHRIDMLALPRADLIAAEFPFERLGVEVKRTDEYTSPQRTTQALKQCVDYRMCVINDRRLPALRGTWVPAVALHIGNTPWPDAYWMERLLGKWNVGSLRYERWGGLTLRISAESIWRTRDGVTGVGVTWPAERRIGNGKRRAA